MSDTYTAVFEREGQVWSAEIAEEPAIQVTADSLPRARDLVRQELGSKLDADPAELKIVDKIGLPKRFKATQEAVRAERSNEDVADLWDKMSGPIKAKDWAKDMLDAGRPIAAVEWLDGMDEDVTFSPDLLCHRITVAEEVGRWGEFNRYGDDADAGSAEDPTEAK